MGASHTKTRKLTVEQTGIFPNTCSLEFQEEGLRLCDLLAQRAPLDHDNKIPVEYLPDVFIENTGFSGAKIEAVSPLSIPANTESYIHLDAKVYDFGDYVKTPNHAPGYSFCVPKGGLYGLSMILKVQNGFEASYVRIRAKITRADQNEDYDFLLYESSNLEPVQTIVTGVKELMLEFGDCVSFTIEQDKSLIVFGGGSTEAVIHLVSRVPEAHDPTAPPAGQDYILDCEDVKQCLPCPDGFQTVTADVHITDPNDGYLGNVHSTMLELRADYETCELALLGEIPLPKWDIHKIVAAIHRLGLSPEDLGLVFTDEQILAIISGYVTNHTFQQLASRVTDIEENRCKPCMFELILPEMDENCIRIQPIPPAVDNMYPAGTHITLLVTVPDDVDIDYVLVNGIPYVVEGNQLVPLGAVRHTLDIDVDEGVVVTTDPESCDMTFLEGEEVTVTITIPDGQSLDIIYVDGIAYVEDPLNPGQLIRQDMLLVELSTLVDIPGATVTAVPALPDNLYPIGTEVVLTIEVPDGHDVTEVMVNGEPYVEHQKGSGTLVWKYSHNFQVTVDPPWDNSSYVQLVPQRPGGWFYPGDEPQLVMNLPDGVEAGVISVGGQAYLENPFESGQMIKAEYVFKQLTVPQGDGTWEITFSPATYNDVYHMFQAVTMLLTIDDGYKFGTVYLDGIAYIEDPANPGQLIVDPG